jgi:hypothetical protein
MAHSKTKNVNKKHRKNIRRMKEKRAASLLKKKKKG